MQEIVYYGKCHISRKLFLHKLRTYRSSHLQMFFKKVFSFKNFAIFIFTGKHLCWSLIKLQGLRAAFLYNISTGCFWTLPQPCTKYLRLTLVSLWNGTLREKFNFYFSTVFAIIHFRYFSKKLAKQSLKSFNTKFRPQWKDRKSSNKIRQILALFCNLIAQILA